MENLSSSVLSCMGSYRGVQWLIFHRLTKSTHSLHSHMQQPMKTADFRPGAKSQRARVENLSYLFVKRAGGPTFYEGRARARARARAK